MLRRWILGSTLLACSPLAVAANGVDLNINNKAVRVTVDFELTNNLLLDGNWYYHQDRGNIFGAGFHVTGAATGGPHPLYAGLGGRLFWIDSDVAARDNGMALPLGGFVTYTLPDYDRFTLGGSLYYAPDVLSFGDVDSYREYNVWGAYSVLRQGQVYLGVRGIKAGFSGSPDVTFDTGLHFGLRLRF
jgi:hypothetical protein